MDPKSKMKHKKGGAIILVNMASFFFDVFVVLYVTCKTFKT